MIYLKRTSRPKRGRTATGVVAALLLALFAIQYFFPRAYPAMLYPVATVFWKAESSTVGWFVNMGKVAQSKYSLVKQNKDLSDRLAVASTSLLMVNALEAENQSLKATLGRLGKGSYVMGIILARPPVSPYDTLVLDVGTNDGVKVGDKVYANGNALIGDIAAAYGSQSTASLFSTPGRSVSVLIGTSSIASQAAGLGGGDFSFKIAANIPIAKGDTVAIPDIGSHIFGVVDSVSVDSTDSLQTVMFKSPVNVNQLQYVEVEK